MKRIFLTLAITIATYYSYAQNTFPSSGNVGIGTTSPSYSLDVNGVIHSSVTGGNNLILSKSTGASLAFDNGSGTQTAMLEAGSVDNHLEFFTNTATNTGIIERMRITNNGNVGIGTTCPQNKFVVSNGTAGLEINPSATISSATGTYVVSYNRSTSAYADIIFDQGGSYTVLKAGGNIGINTTDTKGYMLAVNGTAIATAMTVKLYANWPDYVFKPQYQLPSLAEVKTYIDQNQHLPDMPSEAEVTKNGVNLGEMNTLLTKKVEELTLYLIEQNKQIAAQQKAMEA